jgi:hypothetical protein
MRLARARSLDRRGGDPFGADDVPQAQLFAEAAAASLA